jgi:hypothetical protein
VALNRAPERWAAVFAAVPFVDVLHTMLDPELPLTPLEWPEWGNPLASREAFDTIRAYCPYQNVRPEAFPPVLATAGVEDPRVGYWEPAKWIAALREAAARPGASAASNPVCRRPWRRHGALRGPRRGGRSLRLFTHRAWRLRSDSAHEFAFFP